MAAGTWRTWLKYLVWEMSGKASILNEDICVVSNLLFVLCHPPFRITRLVYVLYSKLGTVGKSG